MNYGDVVNPEGFRRFAVHRLKELEVELREREAAKLFFEGYLRYYDEKKENERTAEPSSVY